MTVLRKYLPQSLVLLLVSGVYLSGNLEWIERWLVDLRFELVGREASGSIVVVEIDAASLRRLDRWPWPRQYYAEVLDRLTRAGAGVVAFDLDFSAHSGVADDMVFATALQRAEGRVVLPVFPSEHGSSRGEMEVLAKLPIHLFAQSVSLAASDVQADADGRVRKLAVGKRIAGKTYFNLPVLLAGTVSGLPTDIRIDYSIRPDEIPRLSFKDVYEGRFDPSLVRGKAVIVGVTAAELADHLTTPVHARLGAPLVKALAYETIAQDRLLLQLPQPVIVFGIVLLAFLLGAQFHRRRWRSGALVAGLYVAGMVALSVIAQAAFAVHLTISPWLLVVVASFACAVCVAIERRVVARIHRRGEVRETRAIADAALQTIHEAIVICDWGGKIRVINQAACSLFGKHREDLIGQPVETLIDRVVCDDLPLFYSKLSHVLMHLSDLNRPLLVAVHQDAYGWRNIELKVSRAVVRKEDGDADGRGADRVYFTVAMRDVTDRLTDVHVTRADEDDVLLLRPDRLN